MTGYKMIYNTLIEQYNTMIKQTNTNRISPENQDVLNKIFNELIFSLSSPVLEFTDILFENICYPISEDKKQNDFKESVHALGNSIILEVIHLRNVITKLISNIREYSKEENKIEYIPRLLKYLQKIHLLLVHILQKLSEQMEKSKVFQKIYKQIIVNSINDFNKNFQIFKLLDSILSNLFNMVLETGDSDSQIFTINDALMSDIKRFTDFNKTWYFDLIINSNAFKSFISRQSIQIQESKLPQIVNEPKFQNYLQARKLKLNILNRRVF